MVEAISICISLLVGAFAAACSELLSSFVTDRRRELQEFQITGPSGEKIRFYADSKEPRNIERAGVNALARWHYTHKSTHVLR